MRRVQREQESQHLIKIRFGEFFEETCEDFLSEKLDLSATTQFVFLKAHRAKKAVLL